MLRRITATSHTWATLPLRFGLGVIFIAHGAQKVFGAFGGPGLGRFTSGPAPLGLQPAWLWMGAAAFAEFVGGVLVLLGLFTRVGAAMIVGVMLVAIFGVHWPAFFAQNRGYEFPLALLCMALALIVVGGGRWSVDTKLRL
jgi:putative oxidoreductase